jgi:hypothetical protein
MHYFRWRTHGDPMKVTLYSERRTQPLSDRLWAKVNKTDTCWLWTGAKIHHGYGKIGIDKERTELVHRVSYELLVGPIPDGLVIDHLCRVTACVNPAHLEAVTQAENVRRGRSGDHLVARTHCPQGHPYDEVNTRIYRGRRNCRACKAVINRTGSVKVITAPQAFLDRANAAAG